MKPWPIYNDDDFTFRNSLFRGVKLNKNPYPDKYSYSGYGISFDLWGIFSLPRGGSDKNVIIFGAGMSSSAHMDNKKQRETLFKCTLQWKQQLFIFQSNKNLLIQSKRF